MVTLRRLAFACFVFFAATNFAPAQSTWINDSGDFSWNTASNWSGGVPDSNNAVAIFSDAAASATKTVTVDIAGVTLQNLDINQSNPLTITGGMLKFRNVGNSGTPVMITGTGTHTINSNIEYTGSAAKPLDFSIASSATLVLNGTLSSSNGAVNAAYTFFGGGTAILNGDGAALTAAITTSDAGTSLVVNNNLGSAVTVGTGTDLTANGNLTIGAVTAQAGGTINYNSDIGGSVTNELLTITGDLIADPTSTLNVTLVNDGSLVLGNEYTITVVDAASISGLSAGQVNVIASGFTFSGTPVVIVDSGLGTVSITFTPVPEPMTTLGVAALGSGAFWLVRRRRKRQQPAIA